MEAVTNHQTGSTRISSLLVATAASAAIAGLIVLGALTGVLPNRGPAIRGEEQLPHVEPQAMRSSACAVCGTIESIRVLEVYEETGTTPAEAKTPADAAGGGPGGAIAGSATSMFDTLSSTMKGNDAEKSLRKRLVYRVTLRMDDGSFRAISLPSPPAFAVGQKVKVVEGRIVRA